MKTLSVSQAGEKLVSAFEHPSRVPIGKCKPGGLYQPNNIYLGDARELAENIEANSVALSIWSPPYHVGKEYERDMPFFDWKNLLRRTIEAHQTILKPGGFLVINIADILCFRDETLPRIMAQNISRQKRGDITRELVLETWSKHPQLNRKQIADILGCSEQTVDRRMKGNNIRGGKYEAQTRVFLVGGLVEKFAYDAGLYLYDRRVWMKDAAWENSKWHTMSYRAVDEFEYLYFFWKPGITVVDRNRLSKDEWKAWGSRAVWQIPSVRANDDHEAKFPLELPRRVLQLLTDPGDLVLDCFVGSGTTGVAAILERRAFIGVDILPEYVDMARRALEVAMHEVLSRLDLERPEGDLPEEDYRYHPVTGQAQLILEQTSRKRYSSSPDGS
ncbi:MAG TPA: site-specific DNA-methyltransferase [Chthonomonadaceae bacterium]|nr:site-specific DNA-methyltransferase [Chthonomonadaceae bacterium]